ncbi:MAG: redox-regulated ATPase YchF [Bacillota bacterium]|nr:MAG: redox-regulated ATPase YchF [Bacillota bacterium]
MLTCGLVGLPGSGKSTLFALLTGLHDVPPPGGSVEGRRVAVVPDRRLDLLAEHFRPKKTTHVQLEFVDIPGLMPGERSRTVHFLDAVRATDALVLVLRGFAHGPGGPGGQGADPLVELDTLEAELILADLAMVETRIERSGATAAVERVRDHLGEGRPFSDLALGPDERDALAHTSFLSAKPVVWVLNVAEGDLSPAPPAGTTGPVAGLKRAAQARGVPMVVVSAELEREIAGLGPDDAATFLADLGLGEPGTARLARAVYGSLGLISFFTTQGSEVRAWTVRRGTRVKEAAGKIHSDMERGFIRAEVISFDDYAAVAAGLAETGRPDAGRGPSSPGNRILVAAREKALVRLEGRDYEVRDGDIVSIRFNV